MSAPSWVRDLLGLWAERDWHDARMPLGLPTVSPMFAKGLAFAPDSEDVGGYSSAEVQAMAAAVEWLRAHHPDHWRAVSRSIRPWARRELPKTDEDDKLVAEAMKLLEKYVDDAFN